MGCGTSSTSAAVSDAPQPQPRREQQEGVSSDAPIAATDVSTPQPKPKEDMTPSGLHLVRPLAGPHRVAEEEEEPRPIEPLTPDAPAKVEATEGLRLLAM